MKFYCKGYKTIVSQNENRLFITNEGASILELQDNNLVEVARFCELKDTTEVAVTTDEKVLAYKNTKGHIAIHDIMSGAILKKSKAFSEEGYGLFFLPDGKRLISSSWNRKIFILDIVTGDISDILTLPGAEENLIGLFPKGLKGEYIILGSGVDKNGQLNSELYSLSVCQHIVYQKLMDIPGYDFDIKCALSLPNAAIIDATQEDSTSIELLSIKDILDTRRQGVIFKYNYYSNRLEEIFRVYEDIEQYGYYTCMCLSSNMKYFLLGYSDGIIIFDWQSKKCLGFKEVENLQDLHFFNNDTKIIVTTWSYVCIEDFFSFLQ